jgi:hypothetical protein
MSRARSAAGQRDGALRDLDGASAAREAALGERAAAIAERDAAVRERDAAKRERKAPAEQPPAPPVADLARPEPRSPIQPGERGPVRVWAPRVAALVALTILVVVVALLIAWAT